MALPVEESRWRRLIEECFWREAGANAPIPSSFQDLIESGALDSMGWVSFLRALESASGINDLGALLTERVPSFDSILDIFEKFQVEKQAVISSATSTVRTTATAPIVIASSSAAFGSRVISSAEIDRAFGMPGGKLRLRAGIDSVAHAIAGEDELSLGARAAQEALHSASCGVQHVDWIIATSETHHAFPSLAAQLHSQLLARETCGALDVGGACLGLLNGFAAAQAFIASGRVRTILVISADVHSRILAPGRVVGEFGGLFGDGASAFLLRSAGDESPDSAYSFADFFFGCAGQYAGAIRVARTSDGTLDAHFDGEALSRAAITRLEKVIHETEIRSGIERSALRGLATHQPNPRLLALLAKQLGLPQDKFPPVAQKYGNLGSSTCGVALHSLLQSAAADSASRHSPIFMASLGPGLLFGGGWFRSA